MYILTINPNDKTKNVLILMFYQVIKVFEIDYFYLAPGKSADTCKL